MIQLQELRIGNCIYSTLMKEYHKVVGVVVNRGRNLLYTTLQESYSELEDWESIPLTPGLLKACGLVYPESDWEDYYFHPDPEIDFAIEPTGDGYAFSGSEFTHGRTFHFLHELQNLFFAMQGRELPVNLPANQTN